MSEDSLPTRWIACVDGTWCNPDGAHGGRYGNISNIYRICASIKVGECQDEISGLRFNQRKKYYAGIGSEKDIAWLKRLESGAFGSGFSKQIREVYRDCCALPDHPQNEVWLFGFSRGAYVVRAVASLLHHVRASTSATSPTFDKDFDRMLEVYRASRKGPRPDKLGYIHQSLSDLTKRAPKIQFVGVLDTVKALSDGSLYDIAFNDSTQHARHALAFNEDRRAFKPKCFYPEIDLSALDDRSIVEAWFMGAHIDIGGSAARDGLALYPLQWILSESRAKGLRLEFDGTFDDRANIDDTLKVCFPSLELEGKGADSSTFTLGNSLKIEMQDLRRVHKLAAYENRYSICLNESQQIWMRRDKRQPFFPDGKLRGYCEQIPQGTIVHPSVFFLYDEYSHLFLYSASTGLREFVEEYRGKVLSGEAFWNEDTTVEVFDRGALRILVCGNTGAGKSTLINAIFGASLTEVSERVRGEHDIRTPIRYHNRPDLIIHDTRGFESGSEEEVQQVKDFINERSNAADLMNQLHVIWFCVEMNSPRMLQKATSEILHAVSQQSKVPVILVLTKKDEFWNLQFGKARKFVTTTAEMEAFADEELRKRILSIEEDFFNIPHARYDDVVAVSREDNESIDTLAEETARTFNHERLRMLYVAAQVQCMNLKVHSAVEEVLRVYRLGLAFSSGAAVIPDARGAYQMTIPMFICRGVINAFGVPSVSADMFFRTLRNIVWIKLGRNVNSFLDATLKVATILGGVIALTTGLSIVAMAVNTDFVRKVPLSTLKLSCDAILILQRAFEDCTRLDRNQPVQEDIDKAAVAYLPFVQSVHQALENAYPSRPIVYGDGKAKVMARTVMEMLLREYTELYVKQKQSSGLRQIATLSTSSNT
ncbi:MAG: hypothetical protein Q9222_003045 [Ikaeria aurantiellina]